MTTMAALIGCLLMTSCDKPKGEKKAEAERPARVSAPSTRRPAIKIEDVPSPAQATWTVKAGDDVGKIATEIYGHRTMAGVLTMFNQIAPLDRLDEGRVLKTPSIASMFHEMNPRSENLPALYRLAKDYSDFRALLPDYLEQRKAQQKSPEAGTITLKPGTEAELKRLADSVEAGGKEIEQASSTEPIRKAINGQLRQVATQLRVLSTGAVDAEGKDYDQVHLHMAFAFRASLAWMKNTAQ
jgi:hypothetical protein